MNEDHISEEIDGKVTNAAMILLGNSDYDLDVSDEVSVTVYGKILNNDYMHILYNHPELDLETVFLLDRVQKGLTISKESIAYLRKLKLVEGRISNLYLSVSVSKSIEDEAQYIKNKGFDDKYYKDMIINYLNEFKMAKKKDIRILLWDKLPAVLNGKQKERKIGNLLSSLKKDLYIETKENDRTCWFLKK